MALTSRGPDIKLKRLDTGKFDFDMSTSGSNKGNPQLSADRAHAVMTTVFSQKRGRRPGDKVESGGYYPDTTGRRGTLLWTVTQDTGATRSQLVSAAEDAGQQLVEERYITGLTADAQRRGIGLGRWLMSIEWPTPQGERRETLRF